MTDTLEAPRSADDLYLARAAEPQGVSRLRPVMTGDIFEGIEIPGVEDMVGDDRKLALVVSHPCSMRQGPVLKERIQAVRVVNCDPINLSAWPKTYYDRLPLPDLTVIVDPDDVSTEDPEADLAARIDEGAHAALLDCRGRVASSELDLDRRIACMTEQGVAFLHQRMSHNDTRHAPRTELLISTCSAVFAEIELWEEWNERLIDPSVAEADTDMLAKALDRVGRLFDEELSQKRRVPDQKSSAYTLRGDLNLPKRQASARRAIYKLLAEHSKSLSRVS